jgi:CRP/FNR family transcriptional regulator, cyclic AMP receptor protein
MTSQAPNHLASCELLGDATGFVNRILAVIEHINLFEDLERADIEVMARYMNCYRAEAGREIIREGEPGDFMLLILEGGIEILKLDARGLPQSLGISGPGKTLGEMSLIDGEPRFASCATVEDSVFAVLDREALTRMLTEESHVGVKILVELLTLLNQRLRGLGAELMKCRDNQRLRIR